MLRLLHFTIVCYNASMQNEQKLGIKVFYYYLYKRVFLALILLIITGILFSVKDTLVTGMTSVISFNISDMIITYLNIGVLVLSLLVLAYGIISSWFDYISCTFILGDNAFVIRRGIFNKREVSIPYRQVQDVSLEQSFSYKMMGVSKLVVLTAGNDDVDKEGESEGVFNVIDSTVASEMREFLLQKTSVERVQEVKTAPVI